MSLKSICENRSSRRRIYVYIRTAEAGFSPDKISDLTALFENTDDINDDSTVQLNYNDIRSRYYDNNRDIFDGIMNLLSDSEKALLYDNSEAVLNYFNENFNRVKTERPQTEPKEDFWIDNDTVKYQVRSQRLSITPSSSIRILFRRALRMIISPRPWAKNVNRVRTLPIRSICLATAAPRASPWTMSSR